jgi:hypothetical protein
LVNNIDRLAEDNQSILDNALEKAPQFNAAKLKHAVNNYGTIKTQRLVMPFIDTTAKLLSTKANRKRLLESIAQDKKTCQALEKQIKNELKKAGKKKDVKY